MLGIILTPPNTAHRPSVGRGGIGWRHIEQRAEFGKKALAVGAFRRTGFFPAFDECLYRLLFPHARPVFVDKNRLKE